MINPYSGVNWETALHIVSCSHEHCETQEEFETLMSGGLDHVAISNYYPSAPVYPLSEKFTNIPEGSIASPNAEHHNMNVNALHINGMGSTFISGSPPGQSPNGCGGKRWQWCIDNILANLQYDDAGGATINHPTWTNLSVEQCKRMLDYDDRVLGVEFYNHSSELSNQTGWAIEMWDNILATGRRCWGFAVADHSGQSMSNWLGRNVLLVSEKTEYNCLKAYRDGNFYGKLANTPLAFTNISFNSETGELTVAAHDATRIKIIINKNEQEISGNSANIVVPLNATYCRIEAHNNENSIYSNPIMINEKHYKYVEAGNTTTRILLGMV